MWLWSEVGVQEWEVTSDVPIWSKINGTQFEHICSAYNKETLKKRNYIMRTKIQNTHIPSNGVCLVCFCEDMFVWILVLFVGLLILMFRISCHVCHGF